MLALYRQQCPLDPEVIFPVDDCHDFIMEIETHAVALTDCCQHLPLKERFFKGVLEGSTPLVLACHYGDFDSVERIIKCWEADVNQASVYYVNPAALNSRRKHSLKFKKATPLFVAASNGHTKSCATSSKEEQTLPQKRFVQIISVTTVLHHFMESSTTYILGASI